MWYYGLAAVLFVLSQLDFFLLSRVICNVRLASVPLRPLRIMTCAVSLTAVL